MISIILVLLWSGCIGRASSLLFPTYRLVQSLQFRHLHPSQGSHTLLAIINSENEVHAKYYRNLAAKAVYEYTRQQSLQCFAPAEDVKHMLHQLRASTTFTNDTYIHYSQLWKKFCVKWKAESRSIEQLLGTSTVERILSQVEAIDLYDAQTVRAFLNNRIFESMLGSILYEGIFEFLQRVDLLGNFINKLPVIGPIRQTIIKEFKANLDRSLGGQIKSFLSSFNQVAVQRMVDFILSPAHRASFRSANRSLVRFLLTRPVASFFPSSLMGGAGGYEGDEEGILQQLWQLLLAVPPSDIDAVIDYVYAQIGDISLREVSLPYAFEDLLVASPALEQIVQKQLQLFLQTEEGRVFVSSLVQASSSIDNRSASN